MENQPQQKPELIPTNTAAKILTLSVEVVREQFRDGKFQTAVQPSGPRGNWRVDRNEVVQRIQPKK
jgi:hypothetical protein